MNHADVTELLDDLETCVKHRMLERINDRRHTHARILLAVVNSERRAASKQLSLLNAMRKYLTTGPGR